MSCGEPSVLTLLRKVREIRRYLIKVLLPVSIRARSTTLWPSVCTVLCLQTLLWALISSDPEPRTNIYPSSTECPNKDCQFSHLGGEYFSNGILIRVQWVNSLGIQVDIIQGTPHVGVSNLLTSLATLEEEVCLGLHIKYTSTNENWWAKAKVLSKCTILCWATFIAILGLMWPTGHGLDTPARVLSN